MGMLTRVSNAWNALTLKATSQDYIHASLPPGAFSWQKVKAESKYVEHRELVERYFSWVYVCAMRNASAVAQIPLELFFLPKIASPAARLTARRCHRFDGVLDERIKELKLTSWLPARYRKSLDEVEEVTEHPFLELIAKANPFENGFEMMEKIVLYLELCGNDFLFMARNEEGVPSELWQMPPQWTKVLPDHEKFIRGYSYGPAEPRHTFEPEEVLHFKYPNPKDLYMGWGPLAAAVDSVDTNTYYHRYEQTLLENYARPDFILSTDLTVGQDVVDRIKGEWSKLFRGVRNQGKIAILEAGLKPVQFNFTPREMAFLQGRQISRDEIAAIFGVPKSLIETKDINRANSETGEYVYAKYTILPRLRRIEQKFNEGLIWPYFGTEYFCAFTNPVYEDKELRLKEVTTHLTMGYSSINEERMRDNLEAVEWGEGDPRPQSSITSLPIGSEETPDLGGNEPVPEEEEEEPGKAFVAVALSRKRFADIDNARLWAAANGFRAVHCQSDDNWFRFSQTDEAPTGQLQAQRIANGVRGLTLSSNGKNRPG